MKNALVIGGATMDTIIEYEDMESLVHASKGRQQAYLLLEEGSKIEVTRQVTCSGGGATNTGVSFKRQGFSVKVLSKIGRDLAGQQVLKELEDYQIDTSCLSYCETEGTASSFVVPALSGDRTVFAYRGANVLLQKEDVPKEVIAQSDFLYITSLSKQSAELLPYIVELAAEAKVPVAVNPGVSQLKLGSGFLQSALSGIDTLILNYEEAQQLMASLTHVDEHLRQRLSDQQQAQGGRLFNKEINFKDFAFSLSQFFKEVLARGPSTVVVTNGSEGVYVATPDKLYFQKAPKVDVVNTLGAGDAFGSSFYGARVSGLSVEEAIKFGVANSTSVIQFPDAKKGLLEQDKLQARVDTLQLVKVKEFTWEQVRD